MTRFFWLECSTLNFCLNGCRVPRSADSSQISVQYHFPQYSTLTPRVVTLGLCYYIFETFLVLWSCRLQAQDKKCLLHIHVLCPRPYVSDILSSGFDYREVVYLYWQYLRAEGRLCLVYKIANWCQRCVIDTADENILNVPSIGWPSFREIYKDG